MNGSWHGLSVSLEEKTRFAEAVGLQIRNPKIQEFNPCTQMALTYDGLPIYFPNQKKASVSLQKCLERHGIPIEDKALYKRSFDGLEVPLPMPNGSFIPAQIVLASGNCFLAIPNDEETIQQFAEAAGLQIR